MERGAMSRERIDHETMAAFLDGKLAGAERERVLQVIAAHPEEYEVFADAARAAAELRGGDVVPIESRQRSGGWKVAIPLVAAAGLAAVLLTRDGGTPLPGDLAGSLSVVPAPGAGSLSAALGPSWDQPGWTVMRGSAPDVAEAARAFRLGVRATDVEIAVRAGDPTALSIVGGELIELVGAVDAGAASAAQYRAIVTAGPGASESERKDAAEALRSLLGKSVWFDVGAWVEAARVAAMAGHRGGFRSIAASVGGVSARVEREQGPLRDEVLARLQSLQMLVDSEAPLDANRQNILGALNQIIVAVGR